jgi:acyl-CoA dehydrogenase
MFAEALETILTEQCTPAVVRAIEGGGSPQTLDSAIAEAGFHELMTPEAAGGGGAHWSDLGDVVLLFGAHAMPLPLAQTLAARALTAAPGDLPAGLITLAPLLQRGTEGQWHATQVPAARVATQVLAWHDAQLVLLPVATAECTGSGIHASLSASLTWPADTVPVALPSTVDGPGFEAIAALLHAGLLAGAMKRAFDMSLGYANERVQFGKSIGKFQAIQHQLAVMAEHMAAARMAAQAAFASGHALPAVAACAIAKARASEAAHSVSRTSTTCRCTPGACTNGAWRMAPRATGTACWVAW